MNPAEAPISQLILATSTQDGYVLIRCTGKLVAGSTALLHSEVKRLIPDNKRIVLDLTDLAYMDSLGLGSVIGLYASAKASGSNLELINFSKRVRELLSITNLLTLFEAAGQGGMMIP